MSTNTFNYINNLNNLNFGRGIIRNYAQGAQTMCANSIVFNYLVTFNNRLITQSHCLRTYLANYY